MNIADLVTPGRTPACWDAPQVFAAPDLDYDPRDEAYRHLDLIGHTMMAARKAAAEEAAVDVCFGCPLMLACEEMDMEATARGVFVSGVVGGRTEAERRARRGGSKASGGSKGSSVPNPQIAPGDRGPRNQVDDELVISLTRAGQTSAQIARALRCSARTVSRARKRAGMMLRTSEKVETTEANSASQTVEHVAPVPAEAVTETAASITRTENAMALVPQQQAPTHAAMQDVADVSNPFLGGRPVSAAMEAVYNYLATNGGTADINDLIEVGVAHVDADSAIDYWTKHHSVAENGQKVLRTSKTDTPLSERVREGARLKVRNAITATERKGRYLTRNAEFYTFKPQAMSAWRERMNAASVAAL